MPETYCPICDSPMLWKWEDAFDKFGFDDGEGAVMTDEVVGALMLAGYDVSYGPSGMHNAIIHAIFKDGVDLIPPGTKIGYDDPRSYLPPDIVQLLDQRFPDEEEAS